MKGVGERAKKTNARRRKRTGESDRCMPRPQTFAHALRIGQVVAGSSGIGRRILAAISDAALGDEWPDEASAVPLFNAFPVLVEPAPQSLHPHGDH